MVRTDQYLDYLISLHLDKARDDNLSRKIEREYPVAVRIIREALKKKRCPFCDARFNTKWGLLKHILSRHMRELKDISEMMRMGRPESEIVGVLVRSS
ncbi:MAG: C2H2-type zinc finger protein [Fervidicoccaceae archaeon]